MVTERDNYLTFSGKNLKGGKLVGGTFEVTDSMVSPNQGKIDLVCMEFDDKNRLMFHVGRHGTSDVADWFKRKLPNSNKNTFSHQPGNLNFAAMGTLTLKFKGGDFFGESEYTFTFDDIVLAQGRSDGKNNWWFGGIDCENCGGHRVKTTGKATRPSQLDFEFHRGGSNSVDSIEVFPVTTSNFEYRSNEVVMSAGGKKYSIVNGWFKVKSHCVTEGQDPLEKIYDGMKKQFSSDGKFDFRVGRNGSPEVAKWFNNNIGPDKNTFGHEAEELNFAVIGDLQMKIKGGAFEDGTNFLFEDVALAQGRTGTANNWWFGGRQAELSKSNTVSYKAQCTDPGKKDIKLYFDFDRGQNSVKDVVVQSVNEVVVYPPDQPIMPPDPKLSVDGAELSSLMYEEYEVFKKKIAMSTLPYRSIGFMDHKDTGTQGAVLVSKGFPHCGSCDIVVVFRGTEIWKSNDWATDFNARLVDFKLDETKASKVHNGFQTAFLAVENDMNGLVNDAIKIYGGPENVDRIIVTGHSLGGALAVFASLSLFANTALGTNRKIHMYSYGAPRVGNQDFINYYNDKIIPPHSTWRFVMNNDRIPQLPPEMGLGYCHVNHEYWLWDDGINPVTQHSSDNYRERVRDIFLKETNLSPNYPFEGVQMKSIG